MNMNTVSAAILVSMGTVVSYGAHGATLDIGETLTITPGVPTYDSNSNVTDFSGSYFALDVNENARISNSEKTALSQGTTGLVIGVTTAPGASHPGAPTAGDTNAIDAPWYIYNNTGSDYVTVAVTGSTGGNGGSGGLNMSGWTMTWNGISAISLGTGAWATGTGIGPSHTGATGTFTNGVANFYWDDLYGGAYSLDYRATVPEGDPSGLGGVPYELHLEGNSSILIPVPAAVWLFDSGLLGLMGVARKRRR